MELLLLLLLCVLVTAADGNGPLTVEEGKDVVLPCSPSSKKNLESELFDWKKDADIEVFMFDAGLTYGNGFTGQDKQFEGRVSHFPDELKKGNASIKITKAQVSDSGTYTCIFPRLQPSQTSSVQLVVGACPKPSAKPIEETKDWSLLRCVVQGASAKPKVEWRDSSGKILDSEEPKTGDGDEIILQTTVYKSDTYSCVVTQENICHEVHDDILVHLSGAASEPSITTLNQTKDWSLLQCVVRGASPKPVVEWRDSSGNILGAKETQVTERGGSYDIILQTTVTQTDLYSCVVTQEEINHQTKAETYVHISGPAEPSGFPVGWVIFAAVVSFLLVVEVVLLSSGRLKLHCKKDEEKAEPPKDQSHAELMHEQSGSS